MNYRKLFAVVAALALCAEISAQDSTTVDSLQQVIEAQRQAMEERQTRLDAMEQAKIAQAESENLDKIWKQRKHFTISIGSQNLTNLDGNDEAAYKRKSTTAISMQMGKTFNLHKKPLANMVRIGLDWNYIEFHYAEYKKSNGIESYSLSRGPWDDDDYDDDYDDMLGGVKDQFTNLGCYQIDGGMAIGPSVQVTPFYTIGKGLEYVKAFTYFHLIPSFSGLLFSENDDTKFGYTAVMNLSWGIGISWRSVAIGFETRWGSGKYDMSAFDDEGDADLMDMGSLFKSDKVKYKTTSSKLTLSLRF